MRIAVLTSHPIQYYAPIFRELARRLDIVVHFAHQATPQQQAAAGFGTPFDWDVDLLDGYPYEFLRNVAQDPGVHHFGGCDTPWIGAKLKHGRFDALLVTGWNLKCYWQGVFAAKQNGVAVLVRGDSHLGTRRPLATRALKSIAYPALLNLFDAALYVGERNRAYWRAYRYPEQRLFFSPHCVDQDFFASRATEESRAALRQHLGLSNGTPAALFAGRLVPFKRPLDLVHAAAVLRREGVDLHVIVAGSGDMQAQMEAAAQLSRVPLLLLGFQNQTAIPAAYAASDVVVLPSSGEETWGLVANEALACKRPIVVSDAVGCAPDLTTVTSAGRVYPVGDIRALSASIALAIDGPCVADNFTLLNDHYSVATAATGVEVAAKSARAEALSRA